MDTSLNQSTTLKKIYGELQLLYWIADITDLHIFEVAKGRHGFIVSIKISNPFVSEWILEMAKKIINENGLQISHIKIECKPNRTIWQVIRGER